MAQSEAAFNNGLRVMFDSAWAPGAIHVSMFFQELVFEGRTLLEMSSVSTSSCHSSHVERFTTLAVAPSQVHFGQTSGWHLDERQKISAFHTGCSLMTHMIEVGSNVACGFLSDGAIQHDSLYERV